MIKKIMILAFLIFLVLGCGKKDEVVEKAEFLGSREVKVTTAELADISSYIEYSGKIAADDAINLKPALGGKIMSMLVDEGSLVKKGDLLAKLDDTQLIQAKTQFNNAEKNYKRMLELKKTGAIDGATFDEVETGYKMAQTSMEFLVENTHILAPIDGVVTTVFKKQGENFDAMMDPFLIRMVNLSKVKAKIQISDADVNLIKKGQNVVLNINNSDEDFTGKISFVSPEADMMAGTFTVEMIVRNKNNKLRNNQFVRVKVLTATSNDAVVVPQEAVIDGDHVFIIQSEKAVMKIVSLGLENEYEIEITTGINAGDEVVVIGNAGLSEGDKVKVTD
ncbi:efflux RND transporter periplasmic adaptor subunit [Candidatus Cloacimonadota bacterium]